MLPHLPVQRLTHTPATLSTVALPRILPYTSLPLCSLASSLNLFPPLQTHTTSLAMNLVDILPTLSLFFNATPFALNLDNIFNSPVSLPLLIPILYIIVNPAVYPAIVLPPARTPHHPTTHHHHHFQSLVLYCLF